MKGEKVILTQFFASCCHNTVLRYFNQSADPFRNIEKLNYFLNRLDQKHFQIYISHFFKGDGNNKAHTMRYITLACENNFVKSKVI